MAKEELLEFPGTVSEVLPNATFRFVKGASEIMSALEFEVADAASVLHAAREKGLAVAGNEFLLGGVTFRVS